jgi:hypothetical protein
VFPLDIRSSEVKSLDNALDLFLQPEKVNMQDNKNASKYVSIIVNYPFICVICADSLDLDENDFVLR